MKLYYSPTSPFARKVRVVAHEVGLFDRLESVVTNPFDANSPITDANPLGKIPALTLADGTSLYDSPVICEYLDNLSVAPSLHPVSGPKRWAVLRLQALADGIMDAVVAIRIESLRPIEKQYEASRARHTAAVRRSLAAIHDHELTFDETPSIGHIAVACACGYLDLRLANEDWRASHPVLAGYYASFSKRPSMQATQHPV